MKDCLSLILVFFFTITFNGCSPKNKIEIQDLDLRIPTEWSFPIHNNFESTTDWWTHFNNPYLDTFLSDVKDYSPDFKTLLQNQKISLNNAKILGANILPSINANINSSESVQNLSAFGFADSFLSSTNTDTTDQVTSTNSEVISFENKIYGLGINYQWEIDIWGRLLNERRAAKTDYEAIQHDLSYMGFSILVRSAILYFQGV